MRKHAGMPGPITSQQLFPALVLHLVKQQPDHGYGLMQRVSASYGDLVAVNTNKMYPLLRRLEEDGCVAGTWSEAGKRARRVYAITRRGEERLERIKEGIRPYLKSMERAIIDLKAQLYS